MSENNIYTNIPVIGRNLLQFGLDTLNDSHGNRIEGSALQGFTLQCNDPAQTLDLSIGDLFEIDRVMLRASANDPLGALVDNIELGDLESPLQTRCNEAERQR